jgi:hypothetical protein
MLNRFFVAMRLKVAGLLTALTLSLSALHASVPVQVWMSADDQFDLYVGDASGATLTYIGGYLGWGAPNYFSLLCCKEVFHTLRGSQTRVQPPPRSGGALRKSGYRCNRATSPFPQVQRTTCMS